jgi:hypothetical protein
MNQPDPRKHQLISFAKSGIRIGGCLAAVLTTSVISLALALLLAEIVGVYEELV